MPDMTRRLRASTTRNDEIAARRDMADHLIERLRIHPLRVRIIGATAYIHHRNGRIGNH
jgi:hypothetical protein